MNEQIDSQITRGREVLTAASQIAASIDEAQAQIAALGVSLIALQDEFRDIALAVSRGAPDRVPELHAGPAGEGHAGWGTPLLGPNGPLKLTRLSDRAQIWPPSPWPPRAA